MFFNFTYWHFLTKPEELAEKLQSSEMRGFNKRVVFVFLFGLFLFVSRELWGMNTESVTSLLATMTTIDFIIARYASLLGVILWAFVYMAFHFWGFAYILRFLTKIPYQNILPLQLLITGLLLLEKAIVFIVFYIKGEVANVSFLSFGPLAMTFLDQYYMIFFLNQLTIITAAIIALQFRFVRAYHGASNWKGILGLLIAVHVVMALITAAVGMIPFEDVIRAIIRGGIGLV
ncbi:hypothetical protein [Sporosarcina sp. HYO08]|uniref:hypothetical protein n=1 Tax=Sporosarcina sp. HYO08 TaxID=1759557 RepID=UPI000796086A|nr:hypothetical protein [Sporosarcina sp. HYO08]KXH84006.1 hypothetical protein AU377_04435 [Sporosarcina sp. HYO08]